MTELSYQEREAALKAAIAQFPAEFGLRAFPGERFRIEPAACFYAERGPVLYVYRKVEGAWIAFSKGSAEELTNNLVRL